MSWLIGIICAIIVIVFWRIFLPLGILAVVAIGLFVAVMYYNDKQDKRERERTAAALKQKISTARANATSEGKTWKVYYDTDPASGTMIARTASITSNDGLCTLSVQKRLNGGELTGLDCPDFKISEWDDIEVKFDHLATSDKMDLKSYSNSDGVYIPSYQADYSGYLPYSKFILRLQTGKAVAIKLPRDDSVWMTFSLNNSSEAIGQLGKEKEKPK